MHEHDLLRQMRAALGETLVASKDLATPIWGDDAAILRPSWLDQSRELIVTQDLLCEGVDFRWDWMTPEQVGFKAAMVNLSDLAAKGAEPWAAFIAVACPPAHAEEWLPALYRGIGQALEGTGAIVAGGDLSSTDGPLVIDLTLLGTAPRGGGWLRGAGRVGDVLWISRPVGLTRLGLLALERGLMSDARFAEAITAQRAPVAEMELSRHLRNLGYRGACMDCSDGLAMDLPRLCAAAGVGAEVAITALPVTESIQTLAAALGVDPLETILLGGEDFALLGATDPATFEAMQAKLIMRDLEPLIHIGWLVEPEQGIRLLDPDGGTRPWPVGGFDHFG